MGPMETQGVGVRTVHPHIANRAEAGLRAPRRPRYGPVPSVLGADRRDPARGTYVRYPWRDLLSLLCLEAWRAGAYVVGEDLGTVEDHAREGLRDSGVLSYKLFWFEPRPPAEWPDHALGAVTTHDLPTVAGVWSGSDSLAQREAGSG